MTFEGLWNLSEFLLEGTRSFSLVRELERSVKKGDGMEVETMDRRIFLSLGK